MPDFYLIKGDLSGIQKFIFNVLSDGAARSIRGRSFFLKIALEVAMKSILDDLAINSVDEVEDAKISTSGGNFILRVKANPEKIISKVEAQFMSAFRYVDINLVLAFVALSDDYPASIAQLDSNIRVKKYQLHDRVSFDHFEPFDHENIKVNKNNRWSDLAAAIINDDIDSWNIIKNNNASILQISNQKIFFAGYEVQFTKSGAYKLDKYIESYNPRDFNKKNQYKQFEHFAKYDGRGIEKLGILAMDVDGLGACFNKIESAQEHKKFDKELYNFFNIKLRTYIKESFDQKVYPVTAGGDDSYFVGHWSIMLELSKLIKTSFTNSFKEKQLTISAAIVIVKPKFPVVRFVELADDEIKKAKYTYPSSKGNMSLFGEVLKWEFLEKDIEKLRKLFKIGISSGLLAKARLTAGDIAYTTGMKLSDYWKMDYYLRNYAKTNKRHYEELSKEFRDNIVKSTKEWEKLPSSPNKDETNLRVKNYRLIFPIAARLAELDKR